MPSEAYREWLRLPAGMMETIVEYRAYAAAYAVYQQNPKATGGLVDEVIANTFARVQESLDGH